MLKDDEGARAPVKPVWIKWGGAEALVLLMQLKTPDEIAVCAQVWNQIMALGGRPIDNDPKHIGKICGLSRLRAERVIHRIIHRNDSDLWITHDGRLFSRFLAKKLEDFERKSAKNMGKNGGQNEQNQSLPKNNQEQELRNIRSISTLQPSVREDAVQGLRRAGLAFGFDIGAFVNNSHRHLMRRRYPARGESEIVQLYNAYVQKNGFVPEDPAANLMAWLKVSTWLGQREGRA